MLRIRKGKMLMELPLDDVVSCQDTSDGSLYLKLKDGSEIFLRNLAVGIVHLRAISTMIMSTKPKNLDINLNDSVNTISIT